MSAKSDHYRKQESKCHICGKVFYRYDVFRCHLRIHNNDKPYTCSVCGKGFAHPGNRNQHASTHLESLPFKCDLCPKACRNKVYLNRHMKKVHPESYIPSKKGQVQPERRNSKQFFKQNFTEMKKSLKLQTDIAGSRPKRRKKSQSAITKKSGDTDVAPVQDEQDLPGGMMYINVPTRESSTSDISVPLHPPGVNVETQSNLDKTASVSLSDINGLSEKNILIPKMELTNDVNDGSHSVSVMEQKVYIPPNLAPQMGSTSSSPKFPDPNLSRNMEMQSVLRCHFCGEVFEQRHKYQLHIMMHELEQGKTCTVCHQTFPSLQEKKKHELSHPGKSTEGIRVTSDNGSNTNSQFNPNISNLKGFSVEDLKVVGMIYTFTGANVQVKNEIDS